MIETIEAPVQIPMGLRSGRRVTVTVEGGYPPPNPQEMLEVGSAILQMFSSLISPPPPPAEDAPEADEADAPEAEAEPAE